MVYFKLPWKYNKNLTFDRGAELKENIHFIGISVFLRVNFGSTKYSGTAASKKCNSYISNTHFNRNSPEGFFLFLGRGWLWIGMNSINTVIKIGIIAPAVIREVQPFPKDYIWENVMFWRHLIPGTTSPVGIPKCWCSPDLVQFNPWILWCHSLSCTGGWRGWTRPGCCREDSWSTQIQGQGVPCLEAEEVGIKP